MAQPEPYVFVCSNSDFRGSLQPLAIAELTRANGGGHDQGGDLLPDQLRR